MNDLETWRDLKRLDVNRWQSKAWPSACAWVNALPSWAPTELLGEDLPPNSTDLHRSVDFDRKRGKGWERMGKAGEGGSTVHLPKCRDRSFVELVEQRQIRHDLILTWHDFRVQWPWWTNQCSRGGSCRSWQSRLIEMFCSWLKRYSAMAPLPCLQAASVVSNCNVRRSSHSGGDLQ